jgi:membrane protein DedA with SNARE-associated domain
VPRHKFLIGTALGALLYCGIFIALGTLLGSNYKTSLDWMQKHFGARDILLVWGVIILLLVAHHFWGRLSLRRLAAHFHRHAQAKSPDGVVATSPAKTAD